MDVQSQNNQGSRTGPVQSTGEPTQPGTTPEGMHATDGGLNPNDSGRELPGTHTGEVSSAGVDQSYDEEYEAERLLGPLYAATTREYHHAILEDSRQSDYGEPDFIGRSEHWTYRDRDIDKDGYF